MFTASSVYHERGLIELITPYNAAFVDAIKLQIPHAYRQWNPEPKTWLVQAPYDSTAIRILKFYFPNAEVGDKPPDRPLFTPPTGCRCDANHKTLYVCQDAPPEVVKASYRALVKVNHPDAGGDHQHMQAINSAYERLTSGGHS